MTDVLVELEALLPELGPSIERRRLGESLGRVADALRDYDRHVRRFKAILEIAQETGFSAEPRQAEALKELMEAAESAAADMLKASSTDDLKVVQDDYTEFTQTMVKTDRDSIRPHWARIVERDFKPLVAIGTLLERINGVSDLGRRLVECGREAANSLAKTPPVETLRDDIRRLHEERASLEAKRASLTDEPEVDAFLNALAEGRATLRIVTEKVRVWLEQNGALDRFSIRPL
jgi:hypothetical protein